MAADLRSAALDALVCMEEAWPDRPTTVVLREALAAEPSDPGLAAAIAIVQQSLDALRAKDDGESRAVKVSIAAREHVITLLRAANRTRP